MAVGWRWMYLEGYRGGEDEAYSLSIRPVPNLAVEQPMPLPRIDWRKGDLAVAASATTRVAGRFQASLTGT